MFRQVQDDLVSQGYTSTAFHPDGILLGVGTLDGLVKIWDVKSQNMMRSLGENVGKVTSISLSEDSNFFATATSDGVRCWDKHNLSNCIWSDFGTRTSCVEFDFSGSYLAAACFYKMRVFRASSLESKWKIISNFITSRTCEQTCVKFSPDARYIVVGSTNGKENLCNYCEHIIIEEYDYDRPTPADVMEMLDCSYAEVMKTIDCYNIVPSIEKESDCDSKWVYLTKKKKKAVMEQFEETVESGLQALALSKNDDEDTKIEGSVTKRGKHYYKKKSI